MTQPYPFGRFVAMTPVPLDQSLILQPGQATVDRLARIRILKRVPDGWKALSGGVWSMSGGRANSSENLYGSGRETTSLQSRAGRGQSVGSSASLAISCTSLEDNR